MTNKERELEAAQPTHSEIGEDRVGKFEKQTFADTSIVIDGNEYVGCRFSQCEIIFAGGSLPNLTNNSFTDCRWTFDGPAGRTVQFMKALYEGGGKGLVEATFDNIRGNPVAGVKIH